MCIRGKREEETGVSSFLTVLRHISGMVQLRSRGFSMGLWQTGQRCNGQPHHHSQHIYKI